VIDKHFLLIKSHIKKDKEEKKERDRVKALECEEEVVRKVKLN
jgi:hypothetical protein